VPQHGASPKGGFRENRKIRWPKKMSEKQQNAWYTRVDLIRSNALGQLPKRQIFLPAARIYVEGL
jgi:hypothetical protein